MLFASIFSLVAILPWYQYGLGQVSVSGYFMHNAVGMWFTPLTLGMLYYALPKLLNRPIYSYALGVFAFWTNLVDHLSLQQFAIGIIFCLLWNCPKCTQPTRKI